MSFEFNQYFLKFMAYHYVSCRFRTFLLDSECERVELGWLLEDRSSRHRGLDGGSDDETGFSLKTNSLSNSPSFGPSFWDYVEKLWSRCPIFYNFWYMPCNEDGVR